LGVVAHTEATSRLRHDYVLFEVHFDPAEHLLEVSGHALPADWRAHPWPASTPKIGTF
jgi:hypothetical protein